MNTVSSSFQAFNSKFVNIDKDRYQTALRSRDNLMDNIQTLADNYNIGLTYPEKNYKFGSFARKTKILPLDDIDLMICFSGKGAHYEIKENLIEIHVDYCNSSLYQYTQNGILNSRKMIENIKLNLINLKDYRKAEIHRNQEAVTLELKSYDWNFDIVPCFFTVDDFYLIPDGQGNWKKTDPRKDQNRITTINQNKNGNILQLVRTLKYWKEKNLKSYLSSYAFEQMILDYCDSNYISDSLDENINNLFIYMRQAIYGLISDPKGIQGDLNDLTPTDRNTFSNTVSKDLQISYDAILNKKFNKEQKAIEKWQQIFGPDFE